MPRVPARSRHRFSPVEPNIGELLPATMADAVVDGVGANVHSYAPYTAANTRDACLGLGLRHIRLDRADFNNQTFQTNLINTCGAAGIKTWWVTDERGTPTAAQYRTYIQGVVDGGYLQGVTGPNEPNLGWGDNPSGWGLTKSGETATETDGSMSVTEAWRQYQEVAMTLGLSNPGLHFTPSALAMRSNPNWFDRYKLGQPGGLTIERFTMHQYGGGKPFVSGGVLLQEIERIKQLWGNIPIVVDECGWHTYPADTTTHKGTPDAIAATWMARLPLEREVFGLERAYLYELFDEPAKQDDREGWFGLQSTPGVNKLMGAALQRTLALYADPGAPFTPQPLPVVYLDGPTDLTVRVHQKRDGSWLIALWRDLTIYNSDTETALTPAAGVDVTIAFGTTRNVAVHTPATGAVVAAAPVTTKTVNVRQDMLVLVVE